MSTVLAQRPLHIPSPCCASQEATTAARAAYPEVSTIQFYYGAATAVAHTSAFALVLALIIATVLSQDGPRASVGVFVFAVTCPALLWLLWRGEFGVIERRRQP